MGDRTMNYFDYNESRARIRADRKHGFDAVTLPGNDSIEVDEQSSVTIDEIREHLRKMRASKPRGPGPRHETTDNPHRHRDE